MAAASLLAPATDADAATYRLDVRYPIASQSASGESEFAYLGPEYVLTQSYFGEPDAGSGTSTDTYLCPINQAVTNWIGVVTAVSTDDGNTDPTSTDLGISVHSDAAFTAGDSFDVTTTSWYGYPATLHLVASCTTDYNVFPYHTESYGDYLDDWNASLRRQMPDFATLARQAFNWPVTGTPANPSRAVAASERASAAGKRKFKLRNGSNEIDLTFEHTGRGASLARSRRPPAIYFSTEPADADCRAERMHLPVIDGIGSLSLDVRCRGLKGGATARLKIRKAIRRSFPLSKGDGTIRVNLDKPAGKVAPFVHLSTGPGSAPCDVEDRKVRMRRDEVDLRVDAHCGQVPRDARGKLYVGGLLAGKP